MKNNLLLLFAMLSNGATASNCINISGIYTIKSFSASKEDDTFVRYEQNACQSLNIFYNGYWDSVSGAPYFENKDLEVLNLDGDRHCNVFGENCYTAQVFKNKILVSHDEIRASSGRGGLCYSNSYELALKDGRDLEVSTMLSRCTDGTVGTKTINYKKYKKTLATKFDFAH